MKFLIACICLLIVLICTNAQYPYACQEADRKSEFCSQDFRPVCGWSDPAKIQCFKYPCAETIGNICEACKNPNTYKVTDGACPDSTSTTTSVYTCSKEEKSNTAACPTPLSADPVCAILDPSLSNCQQSTCQFDAPSPCDACKKQNVIQYTKGACQKPAPPEKITKCSDQERAATICNMLYSPVCGWFEYPDSCTKKPCAKTSSNRCGACSDKNIYYITEGICPTDTGPYVCQDADRTASCGKELLPVCGWSSQGEVKYENRCLACNNKDIIKVTPAPCPSDSSSTPPPTPLDLTKCSDQERKAEACTDDYSPVCGWFMEPAICSMMPCSVTKSNRCMACIDSKVLYISKGECSSSSGGSSGQPPVDPTLCTNEERKAEVCTENYKPVCGWFYNSAECSNPPCSMTESNRCNACKNQKIEKVIDGPCTLICIPGLAYDCFSNEAPSCAWTRECPNGKCLFNATNPCMGCGSMIADRVIRGYCPVMPSEIGSKCQDSERKNNLCIKDYRPTCGVYFDPNNGISTEITQTTYSNRCMACSDEKVLYVFEGQCVPNAMESFTSRDSTKAAGPNNNAQSAIYSSNSAGNTTNCTESERNVSVCTKEYNLVCGRLSASEYCNTHACSVTFDNRCQACNRTDVVAVTEGACKSSFSYLNGVWSGLIMAIALSYLVLP